MRGQPQNAKRSRRQEHRDQSRARILQAAEQAFARDGLAGARTDAIAAEAKVNKALLYYYFESKEELYEAVIEEHMRAFNLQALKVLGSLDQPRTVLLRYVNLHFDFISQRRRHAALFQQFMMQGRKAPERLFRKYIVPRSEALRRLLVRGMREGGFRRVDPLHTAISIAALIVFYFSAAPVLRLLGYADLYAPANLRQRKQEVLGFIQHALFLNPISDMPERGSPSRSMRTRLHSPEQLLSPGHATGQRPGCVAEAASARLRPALRRG